jgi:glycosyltransferase involved in cell wall biosynthesis
MRIALIGPTYPFRGGISHYTTLLYTHLKVRHHVLFVSFKRQYPRFLFPGRTDRDPSGEKISGDHVLRLIDSVNPFTWVRAACGIIRFKAELVILPWWVSFWSLQFWTIATLVSNVSAAKILYLCHNVVAHESGRFDRVLSKTVLRTGDFFVVHSEEDRERLLRMFPDAMVKRSPHPTYKVFNFRTFAPEPIREKFGLKGNVILFFGFVREYKGLRYLIEAMPQVLLEVNVTLLVVGEFWKDKDQYLRLIKERNLESTVVVVDRYVPNEAVGSYFSAADLVVQPYLSATGSGVIQTAFGFNKPVVATQVGSLSEMVTDGKTGFLAPPRDPNGLAKAIVRFFREDKAEAFSKNIQMEQHRFSWERMVETIEGFADLIPSR